MALRMAEQLPKEQSHLYLAIENKNLADAGFLWVRLQFIP